MQNMLQDTATNQPGEGKEEPTPLSLWTEQHGLNNKVMAVLQNEITCLDDLKLFKNEQEIKEFVDSLGVNIIMKNKLLKAIDSIQPAAADNDIATNNKIKLIRWESIDTEKQSIQKKKKKPSSSKAQKVDINKTIDEHKKMLCEKTRTFDSYLDWASAAMTSTWESGTTGKVLSPPAAIILTAFTIIPIAPALFKQVKNWDNQQTTHKKERNVYCKRFNDKLAEIKKFEEKAILPKLKELKKQEEKLNSHDFELERFCNLNNKSKVVMAIGPTGLGKSLVSNRLLGDDRDIDEISDSKECNYPVGTAGKGTSTTIKLRKKSRRVYINISNDKQEKQTSFVLSMIDSPGAFDCFGNDNDYNNMMSHYFGACGGINVFAIFFRFGSVFDSNYKNLMRKYMKFFGTDIWKHCCVFITHCDYDSEPRKKRVQKGLKNTKHVINSFLKKISNDNYIDVPMYMFGEYNFKESTSIFLSSLMDENCAFYNKYKCKNIQSPIDMLYRRLEEQVKQRNMLLEDLEAIAQKIKVKESPIANYDLNTIFTHNGDCRGKHGLQKFSPTFKWYYCDICGQRFKIGYGCRNCNYDLCVKCMAKFRDTTV